MSHKDPDPQVSDLKDEQTPEISQIKADIEQTRQELGETVDALAAKLDVKSRAKHQVTATRQRVSDQLSTGQAKASELAARTQQAARDDTGRLKPVVPAVAGVVALVVTVGAVWAWRRRQ